MSQPLPSASSQRRAVRPSPEDNLTLVDRWQQILEAAAERELMVSLTLVGGVEVIDAHLVRVERYIVVVDTPPRRTEDVYPGRLSGGMVSGRTHYIALDALVAVSHEGLPANGQE